MNHSPRKRTIRNVGLSSDLTIALLTSGMGVANAATRAPSPPSSTTLRAPYDDGTNAPPMSPRGPGGIGGDVKALSAASFTTLEVATVGIGLPGPSGRDPDSEYHRDMFSLLDRTREESRRNDSDVTP